MVINMEIEQLNPSDFSKCGNIWDMEKHKIMAAEWYKQLCDGTRVTFVMKDGNDFVGEISLVFNNGDPVYTIPDKRVYLSRLVVKNTYRKQGIGTKLCEYLFTYAKKLGYSEMSLGVDLDNYPALRLYHKLGFDHLLFVGMDDGGRYVKLMKKL